MILRSKRFGALVSWLLCTSVGAFGALGCSSSDGEATDTHDALTEEDCPTAAPPELLAHLERMERDGWAKRIAATTDFHGCQNGGGIRCFEDREDETSYHGERGVAQTIRILKDRPADLNALSPDGKLEAESQSLILDVSSPGAGRGFHTHWGAGFRFVPDNSRGLLIADDESVLCHPTVVREWARTPYEVMGPEVDERRCVRVGAAHNVAASLDGKRLLLLGPDGGLLPVRVEANTYVVGTMVNTPHWSTNRVVRRWRDFEPGISPSGMLLAHGDQRAGRLVIRKLPETLDVSAGAADRVIAKVCVPQPFYGGDLQHISFSYDERFIVFKQVRDIVVLDLKTMKQTKVMTDLSGHKPLFRADGWLHHTLEPGIAGSGRYTLRTSDFAIRMKNE